MKNVIILILAIILSSCAATKEQNYWVNSSKTDCVGVTPMKCLQVQKSETLNPNNWESFSSPIEGFDYQEGFYYQIKVKEENINAKDIPADASSVKYILVNVIEQKRDNKWFLYGEWTLEKFKGELIKGDPAESIPTIEFILGENRFAGTDGCNRYSGEIAVLNDTNMEFGMTMGTKMFCPSIKYSDQFLMILNQIKTYKVQENTLHLFNEDAEEMLTFRKNK